MYESNLLKISPKRALTYEEIQILKKLALDLRILDDRNISGIGRYAFEIARRLVQYKTEDYYLIGEFEDPFLDAHKRKRIDLGHSEPNKTNKLLALNGYIERYDLVFSPYYPIPEKRTFKGILTIHDLIPLRFPDMFTDSRVNNFFNKDIRKCVQSIDHIIVDSDSTKKDVIDFYSVDENKISVVYLASSLPQVSHYNTSLIYEKFKLHNPYILSVCTLEPRKNLIRVLKAFEIIQDRYGQELRLVLVGGLGWKYKELLKEIEHHKYKNNILLTGYVSDEELAYLYSKAFMMVYPSLYEGFGLPVLEAMAYGVPVVTSNISSLPEVGGDAVIYCEPYQVESIAHAMEMIIANPSLKKELSENGKKRSKLFSWEKAAAQTREIFLSYI